MSVDSAAGARFAQWWVEAITRTAESSAAFDRRAEVASDVYEQLTDAWSRGARAAGSRSVVGRVVRGMPSDISWRVAQEMRASRFAWHLRNPSTAITTLLLALFPLNMAANSLVSNPASRPFSGQSPLLWSATYVVSACILVLASLALAARCGCPWIPAAEPFRPPSLLERARRCLTGALGVSLAASALLRFTALDLLSGILWIAFVLSLATYVALLGMSFLATLLTLRRYLPIVST